MQLQKFLKDKYLNKNMEVINAGVPGFRVMDS